MKINLEIFEKGKDKKIAQLEKALEKARSIIVEESGCVHDRHRISPYYCSGCPISYIGNPRSGKPTTYEESELICGLQRHYSK